MSGPPPTRSGDTSAPGYAARVRAARRRAWWLAGFGALWVVVFFWTVFLQPQSEMGPEQPIDFSHRVHVTDKNISCVFCHEGVIDNAVAGVPPLETCFLCHEHIAIHHPEVEKVREHWFNGEPVAWQQVNELPEFVFFSHAVHINAGADCGACHGDVAAMDRVKMPWKFTMGFCMDCHRENQASIDCFSCHR